MKTTRGVKKNIKKGMRNLNKYKHYIPLVFFLIVKISIGTVYTLGYVELPNKLYAIVTAGFGISFAYVATKEAKKFQAKRKYGAIYSLMFVAGAICYDQLKLAIGYFLK